MANISWYVIQQSFHNRANFTKFLFIYLLPCVYLKVIYNCTYPIPGPNFEAPLVRFFGKYCRRADLHFVGIICSSIECDFSGGMFLHLLRIESITDRTLYSLSSLFPVIWPLSLKCRNLFKSSKSDCISNESNTCFW